MIVWSSFSRAVAPKLIHNGKQLISKQLEIHRAMSGHNNFQIIPSRWQWHKFKDMAHFYMMLGLIPLCSIVFCANVFIGPAQLAPLPTDREPKEYEYYKSPITRFLVKYFFPSYQQEYEKFMHYIYEEEELIALRKLEKKIKDLIADRRDFLAFDEPRFNAKYYYISKEMNDNHKYSGGRGV